MNYGIGGMMDILRWAGILTGNKWYEVIFARSMNYPAEYWASRFKLAAGIILTLLVVLGFMLLWRDSSAARIHTALVRNDVQWFNKMIAAGHLTPLSSDPDGRPLGIDAASKGRTEILELLVRHGHRLCITDELGTTPLMRAAASGYVDTVAFLLRQGCDVNQQRVWGETAIYFAASAPGGVEAELIELLVESGASLQVTTSSGRELLTHAAGFSSDAFDTLLRLGALTEANYKPVLRQLRERRREAAKLIEKVEAHARERGWSLDRSAPTS